MMDGVNKGSFCGGIPGKEQGLSLIDYYLIKRHFKHRLYFVYKMREVT